MKHHYDCREQLQAAGISWSDACELRRISMTLHRWQELEHGDSDEHASWRITRGNKHRDVNGKANFHRDESGKPFLEHHPYKGMVSYTAVADRERGALKRLDKIMARYPGFASYVQGDPRGCALYILPASLNPLSTAFGPLDCNYTRGIAVCK